MPKVQNWKFLTEVTVTEEEFKQYANMQLCASIQRRNKDNCTKCDHRESHKMSSIYLIFNNPECKMKCLVEYKALKCPKKDKFIIMKLNDHEEPIEQREFSTKRGVTPRVKELIEKLIFEYDIGMPKKIHMKIHNKYKKTIEKTQGENLPTLGQIQDFVRNLRRKLGDTNNIERVKSNIEKHGYSPFKTLTSPSW